MQMQMLLLKRWPYDLPLTSGQPVAGNNAWPTDELLHSLNLGAAAGRSRAYHRKLHAGCWSAATVVAAATFQQLPLSDASTDDLLVGGRWSAGWAKRAKACRR